MPSTPTADPPSVLILYNENPAWPASDRAWTARMVRMLAGALRHTSHTVRTAMVFDTLTPLDAYDPRAWVVWNWAEELGGRPWTDWQVAAELERRGFAFTGSSSDVLAASVDRRWIKARLRAHGLATLPDDVFADPDESRAWSSFPAIVKGVTQHGSFGIDREAVVDTPETLAERVACVRATFDCAALVEPFLDTREFHVAVLGDDRVLPPAEYDFSGLADPRDRLLTYQSKHGDTAEAGYAYPALRLLRCPADVDEALGARLAAAALGAFRALGCRDYARVDMRLLEDQPVLLDVNPNCDLDLTSVVMRGARALGWAYHDVVAHIAALAAGRMG